MNNIEIFKNNELGQVRTIVIDEEIWFVGKDVAECLGYKNTRKAILDHVDKEDKEVTFCYSLGGKQEMVIINESGLYSLIFSSKLESAKEFKKWITKEVLPSIRKHGMYMTEELKQKYIQEGIDSIKPQLDKYMDAYKMRCDYIEATKAVAGVVGLEHCLEKLGLSNIDELVDILLENEFIYEEYMYGAYIYQVNDNYSDLIELELNDYDEIIDINMNTRLLSNLYWKKNYNI